MTYTPERIAVESHGGKTRAAHLIDAYIEVQGLRFATKRRVHLRNEDSSLQRDKVAVSIDLSDFRFG